MNLVLSQITSWLFQYKYFALFPLAVFEGPIITIITGFFSSLGYINFFGAYFVIVAGDLVGDVLHYAFGRYGGRKFIDKWGRFIGVGEREVGSLEKQYEKRGQKLLFIGKMTHGVGGAFLIAAGVIKMPFDKYIFSNFLATLIKSMILLIVGYYFGQAFTAINSYLEKIAVLSIAITVTMAVAYILYHRQKTKKELNI